MTTESKRGAIAALGAAHGSATVELQFMVVPELLATLAYVPDPVRCKIVDAEAIFLTGILGDSGRKLVKAGIEFYFTRPLAEKLISKGIAVESPNPMNAATEGAPMSNAIIKDAAATEGCAAVTGYVVPERPGYYWLRHADPIKGNWQPVMVDTVHGVLGFKKFGWAGWMAVTESAAAGLEWGGECNCPHTDADVMAASEQPTKHDK